ncbi:ATP-binding cassette domain-containing protein [Candidatus Gracilibacteria bacterium]|nr:ATP-binding cassette domain-containing protein [Candidatus Gracilibacteria bacterium]
MILLDIRDLHFSYPDGRQALCGVNLQVRPGEKIALVGPNGAGKSTLMLHCNGILRGRGTIYVGDEELSDNTIGRVRASVGLVFKIPTTSFFRRPCSRMWPSARCIWACPSKRCAAASMLHSTPWVCSAIVSVFRTIGAPARRSASPSPPCSRCSRSCLCSMSLPPGSTRARAGAGSSCGKRSTGPGSFLPTTCLGSPSFSREWWGWTVAALWPTGQVSSYWKIKHCLRNTGWSTLRHCRLRG